MFSFSDGFFLQLGAQEAIPAFEEAVAGMKVGGVRRVEIPGELEQQLAYPVDKATRYAQVSNPLITYRVLSLSPSLSFSLSLSLFLLHVHHPKDTAR